MSPGTSATVSCRVSGPVHDPEDGLERRERVVGDLGLRVRDAAQERGLSGIRETRERRVDDELQTQLELELVARKARFGEARRLARRRRETRIASTALAASRHDVAAHGGHEIGDEPSFRVEELRAHGNVQLGIRPVGPVLLAPAAVATATGLDVLETPKAGEIAKARIDDDEHVASATAVPSVGASLRHVLLAPEAQAAVAASTRFGVDVRSIVKHGQRGRPRPRSTPLKRPR